MKINMEVKIGKLKLKNPVMVASGTFGYAEEFKDFINFNQLGAIITKTITMKPRQGNPMPRTCETPAGMLNSIGLENPGLEFFIREKIPYLKRLGPPLIVSISAEHGVQEFIELTRRLDKIEGVSGIELNISCPNLKKDKLIAQNADDTFKTVSAVRKNTAKLLITKLSPNVTDIAEIAQAAEEAGSDALALINTLSGMSIDIYSRSPKIASVTAGLSGPAIRPVAVRMVWQVHKKAKIPIIGSGGIMDVESALEFFIAGANCVSIGTANFINPKVSIEIIRGLKKYLKENKIERIDQLIGSLKT